MNRLLAALGATVSLSLAVWALAWGWVDLGTVSARRAMAGWERPGTALDPHTWRAAHARLQRARSVNPLNADYSVDLARLHEWQALQWPLGSRQAGAYRRQAAHYYGEALAKRPTWGLAWVGLAKNLILLQGLTSASSAALSNAIAYSPWDPAVQEQVIWLGLALWGQLPPPLQARVTESVARAVTIDNRVDRIVGVAIQYGWVERLRPMLTDERHQLILESRLKQAS